MKKLLSLILFLPFLGMAQSPMSTDNTTNIKLQSTSQLRSYNMFQEIIDRLDVQTATGTNTYVISGTLGITSYSGLSMRILFTNGNTASSTLNVNSLGAKTLKNKATGVNLVSGDLIAGGTYTVSYDGTNLQVDLGGSGGAGTVSIVSVVSANGLAGTVANPTTTPAITLSTTVNGLVKGNGTAFSAASAGTDYLAPSVINRQTSDYTPILSDNGKTVEMNSSSITNLTIPTNASVPYPLYTQISITQYGTGSVNILAPGVTLRSSSGTLTTAGQYSVIVIYKIATDEWYVWDGTPLSILSPTYGGTGINNGSKTITLGGSLITTGAFSTTIAASGSNTVTLPNASITVARNDAAQTFTGVQTFSSAPVFSTAFTLPNGTVATTGSLSAGGTNVSTQQYVENALAGVSGWSSNGTTTLGGPVTIVGTSTNTIKYRFNSLGTTYTAGAGSLLANETVATNGNQQNSPSATLEGQGFATGVNNSQSVRFGVFVSPTQLATNPGGTWNLFSNINGAGNITLLSIGHGSNSTATFTSNITIGTGSIFSWTGRGNIAAPSTSAYNFNQSSGSANAILNAGTIVQTYVAKTANYTLVTSDQFVECTSGSFTITLPTAVGVPGKSYVVDNSGAGTITMATTSSQTIDGSAPGTVAAGAKLTVYSNGANWRTF